MVKGSNGVKRSARTGGDGGGQAKVFKVIYVYNMVSVLCLCSTRETPITATSLSAKHQGIRRVSINGMLGYYENQHNRTGRDDRYTDVKQKTRSEDANQSTEQDLSHTENM